MEIQHNIQLKSLNTMATPAIAKWFAVLQSEDDILQAIAFCRQHQCDFLVLGEGSNCVFIDDLDILVLANRIGGAGHVRSLFDSEAVQIVAETDDAIDISVGAGVNWHQLVVQSLQTGYFGLEKLALIPGLVGAAPIQNIGAYGAEVKDILQSVRAIDTYSDKVVELSNEQCEFAYRDSLFKRYPDKYIISRVCLRLSKTSATYHPEALYPALRAELELSSSKANITAENVFQAVCQVRQAKLPSPKEIPNTGSFFKNPVVPKEQGLSLLTSFPTLVHYPQSENSDMTKLAAGWLIEKLGLKGTSAKSGVGCYEKQALVIINPDKATGKEVMEFAQIVQKMISDEFGLTLEIEPRLYQAKQGKLECLS